MLPRFFNTPAAQQFCSPTQVIVGNGTREWIWEAIDDASPCVLVVDTVFHCDPFVVETVRRMAPVSVVAVTQEPSELFVRECLNGLPETIGTVIALGGGSTLDTAKALVAHLRWGSIYIKDIATPQRAPVLIAIPTTVGTGSEVSRYYVLTDAHTGRKRASRSWRICPDVALVDPAFLAHTSRAQLATWSFDAFCHLWETYTSRTERSPFVDMLARDGLARLFGALAPLQSNKDALSPQVHGALQVAGVLGGIAISNIRTGILHDAAEALAAQVNISHPHALMVFFREAMLQYEHAVMRRVAELNLPRTGNDGVMASGRELVAHWESVWRVLGIDQAVRAQLKGADIRAESIVDSICADHVLFKDAPEALDQAAVEGVVMRALAAWC